MSGMGRLRYLVGVVGLMLGSVAPAVAESPPPPTKPEPNPAPVVPPAITDAGITASITARLEELILLRNAQVTISTKDRVVTLIGMVPTDFAHQQALQVARSTVGVVMIDDQLRLPIWSPQATTRN
jgi:BON domain-containing protein